MNKLICLRYLAHLEIMYLRSEAKRDRDAADEEKTQALLKKLMRSGDIKKCPYCSVMIQRDGGCRKVLCRECRCKFCWHCLQMETHGCDCRADRHLWLDNTTGQCEDVGDWEVAPLSAMRHDDDEVSTDPDEGSESDSGAEPETKSH